MHRVWTAALAFLLLSASLSAISGMEILRRAEQQLKGKTSTGVLEMQIIKPDFTRTLKLRSWWVGNQKALIEILSPQREAGNKTLKIGKNLWMYLRNTETTIRIPPSMMLQSWNGSDFTYDDLVRESNLPRDYRVQLLGTDTVDGIRTWKLLLTPKPEAPVVWGKILYWVRQKDYLPAKVEYYDEHGRKIRTFIFRNIRTVGNRRIPAEWIVINNRKPGNRTLIRILEMQFDIPIPDRIFSLEELEG